ncbi:MAG: methyltransferase domain-containing protein, partial [Rhodobacteraceae bacterium]|nr:methyltransferase domain-containing protein [Paracoccaceae bacterium]
MKLVGHAPIVHRMSSVPQMTDRAALRRNRKRVQSEDALFLQAVALQEVQDRLTLVNKSFTKIAIVTPFPEIWRRLAPNAHFVQDNEVLELEEKQYDLVIHALCLHWANDPVGQIIQCRRALENDGLFMCLTFGGQTLHELRASLAEAETLVTGGLSPRVAPMAEVRDLGDLLQRGGLALPVADTIALKVTYETPWNLFRELREIGEGNALEHRIKRFSRRQVFFEAAKIYAQSFMDEGRIPATFEMVVLTGWA